MSDLEKNEYEMQLFGFSAQQVTLERKHFLDTWLSRALDTTVEKLTKSEKVASLLAKEKDTVKQSILDAMEPDLKALEELDKKLFSIPDHVLLPQDFELMSSVTEEDENALEAELVKLRKTFTENSIMLAALNTQNEEYEALLPWMEEEDKVFDAVEKSLKSIDEAKLQEMVEKAQQLRL